MKLQEGFLISLVIANIFVEHFEKEVLRKTFKKPEIWFRYVDDIFVIWRHGKENVNFLFSSTINIQQSTSLYKKTENSPF